ncbi:MAG: DEAD/DEAH box helicase [Gammaproteobacteria bacterium]|nr:DEAD/DEAH box helicase [Gammaproteobacteria bacterium]
MAEPKEVLNAPFDADPYAALSPAARLVAQAYGVVAPHGIGVNRTANVLAQASVSLLGRSLTQAEVRRANDELINAGIGIRPPSPNVGVAATRNWAVPLAVRAQREGRLRQILEAFQATRPTPGIDRYMFETLFRCYVLRGDFDNLDALLEGDPGSVDAWRFLAEPLAVDVLATLPERYIDVALTGCLRHTLDIGAPPEPAIQACHRFSGDPARHAADIAYVRILQGRFDAAEAVFSELPREVRDTKPANTGLASTRAMIAMLRGDNPAARQHIDAAIAAEKAGTRKRNVFPEHAAFALSLIALVRLDTPESRDLMQHLLRTAERRYLNREIEVAFAIDAARLQRDLGIYARRTVIPCYLTFLDGFRNCWLGSDNQASAEWLELMDAYRSRASASGYRWIAAESASILHRLVELRGADLAGLPDPQPLLDELGIQTLAVLEAPMLAWERSLKALEQLAYDANNQGRAKRATSAPVEKRLVWDVDRYYDNINVTPREQRRNKNGTWSKGRRVALKRLAEEAPSMDHLREEDLAAAAAVTVHRSWGRIDYVLGIRGLYALAGHPHVFNESGEPIDVFRREPELRVDESAEGQVVVTVDPHGWESEGEYGITLASDHRIEVTRFSANHRRLFDVIPPEGLVFPTDGKSRLLEAVSALVSQVRVQSDAGSVASAVEVEADAEPWVRLEPFEAGLAVSVLVEPIADSGISFEPGQGGATVFAGRDGEHVQARRDLVRERNAMAQLAERCPRLKSRPTEYTPLILPDPAECLELLEQLDAAGARCKWPKGEPFRIVARHGTPSLSLTVTPAQEWLQASGKLRLDADRVLDLKRLFALLEANPGSRFLELEPGEFLALTGAFRRHLDDLASLSTPAARGAVRMHSLAATSLTDLFDEADIASDEAWQKLRADLSASESFEPEIPSTLQAELRPYQVDGHRWLARLSRWGAGACLADDMGLGKTVQTLAVLLDRAPGGAALVVAPTSVVANWVDEARRFAPTLNVKVYTGTTAARAPLLDDPAAFDLYVTTYGLLQNDVEALAAIDWHSVVLDEAQAIKNPLTKRARAARQLSAGFRVVTTGTPIQNNLMDLHSLFSFLNPGLLGSRERFRTTFGEPVERDGDEEARSRLRRVIAPFVLRRLKTEVLDDLPERTEITLHVTLSPEEAALYETLRLRAVEQLEAAREDNPEGGDGERFQLFAHLTRLRLACCNPRLVVDTPGNMPTSSKLETFAETLDELLENRHKVLVFSQFVKHLKLVEEHLKKQHISYQYLDGSTPAKARSDRIAAFQAGQGDVFLISLKAGGTGLNLTAADYVIHMDPWWNPAVEDQASDRAHRIGQTRPVTIYRLVTEGTIEEQIVDIHHRKRDLADRLLEGSDAAGRLSTEELLELLRSPPSPARLDG